MWWVQDESQSIIDNLKNLKTLCSSDRASLISK